jgi:RNA polymerase sigma-70 factor (ECF subfamily)
MKHNNESNIIRDVLKGDTAAFAQIVETHKQMIFTLAFNILKNRQDAEEAAQDTFVKAYKSLAQFKGDSSLSTWLYRIVYHTSISMLRRRSNEVADITHPSVEKLIGNHSENGQRLETLDRKKILKEALLKLDEEDSFLVLLFYYKDHSIDEIASITSLSISNVKVKLHRARKKLNELLSTMMQTEPDSLLF